MHENFFEDLFIFFLFSSYFFLNAHEPSERNMPDTEVATLLISFKSPH